MRLDNWGYLWVMKVFINIFYVHLNNSNKDSLLNKEKVNNSLYILNY